MKYNYIMENNFLTNYLRKIDEFIYEEKEILDLLKTKLTLLNPEFSESIEKTKINIKNHEDSYLFLIDMKVEFLGINGIRNNQCWKDYLIKFLSVTFSKYGLRVCYKYEILNNILNGKQEDNDIFIKKY